ncbi:flagellar biosynthetic protein FliQ [Acidithiobacillus ferrivorans]|uniref:Flagellar biosynthetic protein FliQ n=3 Tax=Acidithiobacillus ferrivorans TaxID=160808 RepID=A0A060UR87_9PROT|nr:flagellar biosynthetic protein FliQ [Acidithiobacillus ferrivorans]MBN6738971.1 flagellar biosynthetic protein FliQ [Acidithiobacillus sp. MC6.1]CDQ11132.1 Flagellar biosynthetic protein FliQ [Acidithiobacillus ferrivorans]
MVHDGWMLSAVTQAARTGALMALPLLGAALIAGIVIGFVQVATQLSDMSVGFVPKAFLIVLVLFIGGPWLVSLYIHYMAQLYMEIPHWVQHR